MKRIAQEEEDEVTPCYPYPLFYHPLTLTYYGSANACPVCALLTDAGSFTDKCLLWTCTGKHCYVGVHRVLTPTDAFSQCYQRLLYNTDLNDLKQNNNLNDSIIVNLCLYLKDIPLDIIFILHNHMLIQRIIFAWISLRMKPSLNACTPVDDDITEDVVRSMYPGYSYINH